MTFCRKQSLDIIHVENKFSKITSWKSNFVVKMCGRNWQIEMCFFYWIWKSQIIRCNSQMSCQFFFVYLPGKGSGAKILIIAHCLTWQTMKNKVLSIFISTFLVPNKFLSIWVFLQFGTSQGHMHKRWFQSFMLFLHLLFMYNITF